RDVIPHSKVDHPRVTHPFATLIRAEAPFAFDLHVLGTPPALILSQDQTLKFNLLERAFDCLLFSNCVVTICLVSPPVTRRQLTLDGLVARFEPCPCGLGCYRTCARSI